VKKELYVFIDNSFLFIQGYKHVKKVTNLPNNKKPVLNYKKLRNFIEEYGEGIIKRIVLVGSNLSGNLYSTCQLNGIEPFSLPKYPDIKSGRKIEKGVDMKVAWEIAKTIFTNKDPVGNKKIILCSGDKDFISILSDIHTSNWSFELWLWNNAYSKVYEQYVNTFGSIKALDNEWKKFIDIVDSKNKTSQI